MDQMEFGSTLDTWEMGLKSRQHIICEGKLNQLQDMISTQETEDKTSVVLASLQKLSDDFCDEDFWKAFKSYLKRCDLKKLSSVCKLIDTLKSVSSTQSGEFEFYLMIYILKCKLLHKEDVKLLCLFVNDNFKKFQPKTKNWSHRKKPLYEGLLHQLQDMISTNETEDEMSVVLGSLQKLSDDFCDEDFWEAFKSYLQICDLNKLSPVCKLIDTLKSVSSTQSVEFDFFLFNILKKLFCESSFEFFCGRKLWERSFEVLCGFVKDNFKKFKFMMDVVQMKNQSDEKRPLYEVLLHLLQYMNSKGQTEDKISVVLLGSLQELSDDFCDEDFWEAFKSYLENWDLPENYLQRPDCTWFLYVCKLIDNIKSTSSTATEAFDFHSIYIIKIILNKTDVEIQSRMNIVNREKQSYEKQKQYKIRLHLLQLMLSTEQTDGSMTVILGSLQNLSDDFCDEDFWEVYRRYLLGFDLNKVSFLSRFTYAFKEAYPKKTKDFDLYLFYILERLFYETNKPGAFVNDNLEMFITMVDKVNTKKKSYKTVCPVLLYLLQSWISTEQFKDKMIAVSYFSKDFLDAVQSDPLKHYKKKMSPLMRLIYTFQQKANERRPQIGEMGKRNRLCLLLMLVISLIISFIGHKSAQLKKYLALKYEYDKAILYLLWCSGDVEINPGPPTKKGPLIHDSEKERKWIQDMSSTVLKLYRKVSFKPKTNNLWKEKPEHWPPSKPFYDTKNKSKDENGNVITDEDLLTCLIECCKKTNVTIPVPCQYEINVWSEKKKWLLFKLHTYRIETETIKSAIENLMSINNNSIVQMLKDINVSLQVESGIILTKNQTGRRTKCQAEMVADITKDISVIFCKIIKGKDPEKKCDGIWKESPDGWPQNISFFDPNNRGKYREICSNKTLTETFLQHPKAIIPSKYKDLVATYQIMVKTKVTNEYMYKEHKDALCRIYETQNNITKLDNALQYLHEDGLFKQHIHYLLQQWLTTQQVDKSEIEKLSRSRKCTHERPEVVIRITHDSITLSAQPCDQTCQTKTTIDYSIPVKWNPINLTTAQANNQPSASTSCHKSHDNQQNQLQTESTGNQQGSPSHADVNCSKDNQPDVPSNHFSQQNSSNDQSDSIDDSKLPHPTEGTSNTQAVFINNTDILQSTAKPKIVNRCKGSPTKPNKYKSKKISSTVLLIKKCSVKNVTKDQNRPSGILGSQEHLHIDCMKSHYGSEGLDSTTSQNVSSMTLNNQPCSAENLDTLQSSKQQARTDDDDHGLNVYMYQLLNCTTTNDEDHGLVPNSPSIDHTDHRPATISPTTDDSQLISKTEKRKHSTDENIPCISKRSHLETDKTKRKPSTDRSISCKKQRLESDKTDDRTYDADQTLPSWNNVQSIDFLDFNMADLLLNNNTNPDQESSENNDNQSKLKDLDELHQNCTGIIDYESGKNSDFEKLLQNTNPDQCKNSSEINDKQSQLKDHNSELESFLIDMLDGESGKKSDIENMDT